MHVKKYAESRPLLSVNCHVSPNTAFASSWFNVFLVNFAILLPSFLFFENSKNINYYALSCQRTGRHKNHTYIFIVSQITNFVNSINAFCSVLARIFIYPPSPPSLIQYSGSGGGKQYSAHKDHWTH